MAYLIGGILALAVGGLATVVGLDRDRAFYPTVLIVIASYYPLFAVMGGSHPALVVESGVATGFVVLAIVGIQIFTVAHRTRAGVTWHPRRGARPSDRQSRRPGVVAGFLSHL